MDSSVSIFAPAKLNVFLAITGRRADGFHDLVSVVVRVGWGDTLKAEAARAGSWTLECDDPAVPTDATNLVLKAAEVFARQTGWGGGARFFLEKRVPMGAGLGGGSSDGVAALRALRRLSGVEVSAETMTEMAAELGSDCPLFLQDGPVVMRGRGERVELLADSAARRLRGRRVLVFKPAFGIATAWAYGRMAACATDSAAEAGSARKIYLPADQAEARLAAWVADASAPAEALLFNNMETVAFTKFLALPTLLERLSGEFGVAPRMSGSGSACFAFLPEEMASGEVVAAIREAWGESAFVMETRVL